MTIYTCASLFCKEDATKQSFDMKKYDDLFRFNLLLYLKDLIRFFNASFILYRLGCAISGVICMYVH